MSLVTRCPSCATTFKVVRDQLRISDGWVRCGRCSNVFDATLDLTESPDAAPSAPAPTPAEGGVSPSEADSPSDPAALLEPEPDPGTGSLLLPPVWPDIGVVADEPWPNVPGPAPAEPMPVLAEASLTSSVEALDDFSAVVEQAADAQLQKALRRARIEAVRSARARRAAQVPVVASSGPLPRAPAPPPPPEMPLVTAESAVEQSPEPVATPAAPLVAASGGASRWWPKRKPANRAVWVAAIVCVLLLGLQLLRHERDTIVARQPALRPVLSVVCAATGCELSALRQIGAITIDGAAFAREKAGDGYRLSFTLRNAAAVPLAMPAVELSLLDTQERPVVRRVLTPTEFGAPAVLPARAERAVTLPLVLTGPEAAALPPVAGYRVVAFYP